MGKRHLHFFLSVLLLSGFLLIAFWNSSSKAIAQGKKAPADPPHEKLEYDIMTIDAQVLLDFLNGTNKTGGNPGTLTATAIILQHQNPLKFESGGKRHEFRCVAYIQTGATMTPVPNRNPHFFVDDNPSVNGGQHDHIPIEVSDSAFDQGFANYYITRNNIDMHQAGNSQTIILTPFDYDRSADLKRHYVHYYLDYVQFLSGKKNMSTLNKIIHVLDTDSKNPQKLSSDMQKLEKQENFRMTGGSNYLNPSPPA